MEEEAKTFIRAYFSPELFGEREGLKRSLHDSAVEYQRAIKDLLANMLMGKGLSILQFYRMTGSDYETEDEAYADIASSYEILFAEAAPKRNSSG